MLKSKGNEMNKDDKIKKTINEGTIIAQDSVWTQVSPDLATILKPILTYKDVYWQRTQFKKERVEYTVCMITYFRKSNEYWIHTGFIPRITEELKRLKVPFIFHSNIREVEYDPPYVKGITFREDQKELLDKTIQKGRGVILSATGTGKSILFRGLVNSFSQEKILFLVHTLDLVKQMISDIGDDVDDIGEFSGTKKEIKRVTIATIQSFSKVVEDHVNRFDVIFVDECHHASDLNSNYGKTLTKLSAPIKIGLTATLPTTQKGKMCLEALIGPVTGSFSVQDAVEKGILAKPIIKIVKIPKVPDFNLFDEDTVPVPEKKKRDPDYKPVKYRVVYWNGIVTNTTRNMIILDIAEEEAKRNRSILISVVNVEHGEEISSIAEDYFNMKKGKDFVFIHGGTPKEERKKIKKDFEKKKIPIVIATVVWNEGINIVSLNSCIIASGGRGENPVLQKVGRGLRKKKGKETVTIYDLMDENSLLRDQFNARVRVYREKGWLS